MSFSIVCGKPHVCKRRFVLIIFFGKGQVKVCRKLHSVKNWLRGAPQELGPFFFAVFHFSLHFSSSKSLIHSKVHKTNSRIVKSLVGGMASLLDSEAQFESRALEIGLAQAVVDQVKRAGVNTLSRLAFAVGQPGQAIVPNDVDNFLQNCLARAPTLAESAGIRRLAFEAQTFLVASLRQVVEQRDDGIPKKIGAAERETRMRALRAELAGLDIQDEHEPSHALLERACQINETNNLKYIELSICTSRNMEVQGGTKSKELAFDNGALVVRERDNKLQVPTDTEMKLNNAFIRRGLAFKFARLMNFEQHSKWVAFLFSATQREMPPGYSRPSLHQLVACDKAAFTKLGSTLTSVRARPDGTFPLGEQLLELRTDPLIALHLAPLARPKDPVVPPRPSPYDANPGGKPNLKGKGKGKAPPMSAELRGKWHKHSNGEPLCFGYNTTRGCTHAKDGEKCRKGWHLCAEPKCLQAHSLQAHPKDS